MPKIEIDPGWKLCVEVIFSQNHLKGCVARNRG